MYLTSLALLPDQKAEFSNFNSREISQKEELAGRLCPSQEEEQDPLVPPTAIPVSPEQHRNHPRVKWAPELTHGSLGLIRFQYEMD